MVMVGLHAVIADAEAPAGAAEVDYSQRRDGVNQQNNMSVQQCIVLLKNEVTVFLPAPASSSTTCHK